MKITSITYPDGSHPEGREKIALKQRIKQALGRSFYVCELDRCWAEFLAKRPGEMARTLARTVRDDVGEYEVALTVTPIASQDGEGK